jgi:hypothetical protein
LRVQEVAVAAGPERRVAAEVVEEVVVAHRVVVVGGERGWRRWEAAVVLGRF